MDSSEEASVEDVSEEASPESLSEEAHIEALIEKKLYKHFEIPPDWPKWRKVCGAKLRKREGTCRRWAVIGNPRCKFHGSGGEVARIRGQIRYLCWIITGGPQNMPVESASTVALFTFAEAVLSQGKGTLTQQMKAAMWLTSLLDE